MIPVTFDISGTINAFNFSESDANALSNYFLDEVQFQFMQKLEQIVDEKLHKSADSYKSGMDAKRPDDYSLLLILEGKQDSRLGMMIEEGAAPWDIKEGFERSTKKTIKKNGGWYLTIPFSIATASAVASSSVFSGKMNQAVLSVVQNLGNGESLSVANMPPELQVRGIRAEISGYKPAYEHKNFDFEGLRHSTKPGHGQYEMFRRVSDISDENSWIHKGFEPHKFMEQALEAIQIDQIFVQAKTEFLEKFE